MKARKGDDHSKVQEVSHPSEPEKMLKDCTEAATEELSRKKIELCEWRQGIASDKAHGSCKW